MIDISAYSPRLLTDGKEKERTERGGILTILAALLIGTYFLKLCLGSRSGEKDLIRTVHKINKYSNLTNNFAYREMGILPNLKAMVRNDNWEADFESRGIDTGVFRRTSYGDDEIEFNITALSRYFTINLEADTKKNGSKHIMDVGFR